MPARERGDVESRACQRLGRELPVAQVRAPQKDAVSLRERVGQPLAALDRDLARAPRVDDRLGERGEHPAGQRLALLRRALGRDAQQVRAHGAPARRVGRPEERRHARASA
jgi:hypothetical protein